MPSKQSIQVHIKRAYEPAAPADGTRVLVDRLWPRGVSKAEAHIDLWLKDIAPSTELRQWYGHDQAKWEEFRRRYREELSAGAPHDALRQLREMAAKGPVTLVCGAKDVAHANAEVIREMLEGKA
jgi:uncharacterized protein YeaO (DUF488 family)